ncbi:MAG: XTP/dITP diphosphatase [Actinobacteria bacterium]|nr:MAG: XTP/dITP diphosphatase [Actinomycetota bacterium]
MSRKVVLATKNRGKIAELREILAGSGLEVLSGEEVELPHVEETGSTFEENALRKASVTASALGMAAIADDSGLVVDVLGGEPGVRSARYAGDDAGDEENIAKLLSNLAGVPPEERTARFVCAAAYVESGDGESLLALGSCEGRILSEPRGEGGFGYDPVFLPEGYDLAMAELPPETKNAISHRGKAFRKLRDQLRAAGLLR